MPLTNDIATAPRPEGTRSAARDMPAGKHVRSRFLGALLMPARRAWQRGWDRMPAGLHRFRVPLALAMRGLVGLPVERSTNAFSAWSYRHWIEKHDTLSDADRAGIRRHLSLLDTQPLISVIMPVYDPEAAHLRAAIASVRAQIYPRWELCIADDASTRPHVAAILAEAAAADPRIRVVTRATNGHISAATNTALALATGDFVALMDHDDLLAEQALYEVAVAIAEHPDAAVIYSDEDKIDEKGLRWGPYFKSDFDPDLLLAQNMISHLGVYRRDLLEGLGGLREGLEGSQDHDLALRATAACGAARVHHIPAVLYHWRQAQHGRSFSQTALDRCAHASRRAVAEQLAARGAAVTIEWARLAPQHLRIVWPVPEPAPLVTVIVPTRDRAGLLRQCAEGVLDRTDYKTLELLIMDNGSTEPETLELFEALRRDARVRVIAAPGPFNYSALNNQAVREARGEILLLLNNDVEIIDPGWLHEMVGQVMRPDVGAVGAKLLYPDDTVQHGGVILGAGGVAGHFGLGVDRKDPGPLGVLALVRQVSAVTAACLAIRRTVYDAAGGLDEKNLTVAFNDVDLCIRIGRLGLRILWTPFAELYHHESVSRGFDTRGEKAARFAREIAFMQHRWQAELDQDPFYNPNLDTGSAIGNLAGKPRRAPPWRAVEAGRRRAA